MRSPRTITVALVLVLVLGTTVAARAAQAPTVPDESITDGRTPPRLSYADGQVSFWRPGAPDWVAAQINTPLAPGDELYTGSPGNLEIQIGSRAFIRAWAGTSLGLVNHDPGFVQIKVTTGYVSLDLRALDAGRVVELDTPSAAFTIDHAGYYRVDVAGERTSFIARRGGRATVTPANGQAAAIAPSEEIVVEGTDAPRIVGYVAPALDDWDRWNYARSDYLIDAVSARYVSPAVYGVSDLDRYGRWRVVSEYGPVWVPTAVPPGWVPYSTGSWTWDPYYGWTWVDTAPWGWAPFHYGRWAFVDGFWAWAPGPVVVRTAYAPALVAFFGAGPGVAVRVGPPVVGWVALGWGEPVIPWWGAPRFVGVPWWGGWGGPRVVNNVVIKGTTVVNVQQVTVYRNATVRNALVAVEHQRFGHGPVVSSRVAHVDVRGLEPVRDQLVAKPSAVSLAPTTVRGVRPPDDRLARPVVATRAPQPSSVVPAIEETRRGPTTGGVAPSPRLVPAPREVDPALVAPRPPFGQGRSERPQPPPPPRFRGGEPQKPESRKPEVMPPARPAPAPQAPSVKRELPVGGEPRATTSPAPSVVRQAPPPTPPTPPARVETPRAPVRSLPGEAANRLSPGRGEVRPSGVESQGPRGPQGAGAPAKGRE
jgi:hypothetical protein